MSFLWTFMKCVALAFVPIPVNPWIAKTEKPNTWSLTCDGFTSVFQEAKVFWKTPAIEELLGKSRTNPNVPSDSPPTPSPPGPEYIQTRRPSLRGSALSS